MKSKHMHVHTLHKPYKPNRTLQSQGTALPCQAQSKTQNTLLQSSYTKKENSFLLVPLYLCSWAVVSIHILNSSPQGLTWRRREMNSSELVLSCNALLSRTSSSSLSGHKGRVNSSPANFQMDSIQSDLLAFNFPKWTHSDLGEWDVCPCAYR